MFAAKPVTRACVALLSKVYTSCPGRAHANGARPACGVRRNRARAQVSPFGKGSAMETATGRTLRKPLAPQAGSSRRGPTVHFGRTGGETPLGIRALAHLRMRRIHSGFAQRTPHNRTERGAAERVPLQTPQKPLPRLSPHAPARAELFARACSRVRISGSAYEAGSADAMWIIIIITGHHHRSPSSNNLMAHQRRTPL